MTLTRMLVSIALSCTSAQARVVRLHDVEDRRAPAVVTVGDAVLPARGDDAHRRFYEIRFRPGSAVGVGAPLPATLTEPTLYEACRRDRFFVHFPAHEWPAAAIPADPDAFLAALSAGLGVDGWAFEAGAGVLTVKPGALPTVVTRLRAAAHAALGEDGGRAIRVGRVCTFGGQGAVESMTAAQKAWHVDRIEAEAAEVVAADAAYAGPGLVDLALVDSGVVPALTGATEVAFPRPFGDVFVGAPAAHGTWMALLVRQLLRTTAVDVRSYRVLGPGGSGTTHDLAAGLDAALSAPGTRPLVVSLSLGWAAELGQPRTLRTRRTGRVPAGFRSSAVEDGVGSAVRHLLDRAYATDLAGARRVMVVTAAGNRTRYAAGHQRDALAAGDGFDDPCWGKGGGFDKSWFLPGEWAFTPTCDAGPEVDDPPVNNRWVSTTVTAVDARDLTASVSLDAFESPIVAPGQHVVVDRVPGYGDADDVPEHMALPVVLTGTSVAAALTAAAAARAQIEATSGGLPAMRWDEIVQLLYLSGRGTGRPARTLGGGDARRIDVCGLRRAATCTCAEEATLAECVSDVTGQQVGVTSAAEVACGGCLDACLAADPCRRRRVFAPAPSTAWLASHEPTLEVGPVEPCVPDADGACASDFGEVAGAPTPTVDQYLAGDVGPQPVQPICPDCSGWLDSGSSALLLVAPMNPKITDIAHVVGVSLVVKAWGKTKIGEVAIPKAAWVDWMPGDTLSVSVDVSAAMGGVPTYGLTFELKTRVLVHGSSKPVGDNSPLMTKVF